MASDGSSYSPDNPTPVSDTTIDRLSPQTTTRGRFLRGAAKALAAAVTGGVVGNVLTRFQPENRSVGIAGGPRVVEIHDTLFNVDQTRGKEDPVVVEAKLTGLVKKFAETTARSELNQPPGTERSMKNPTEFVQLLAIDGVTRSVYLPEVELRSNQDWDAMGGVGSKPERVEPYYTNRAKQFAAGEVIKMKPKIGELTVLKGPEDGVIIEYTTKRDDGKNVSLTIGDKIEVRGATVEEAYQAMRQLLTQDGHYNTDPSTPHIKQEEHRYRYYDDRPEVQNYQGSYIGGNTIKRPY